MSATDHTLVADERLRYRDVAEARYHQIASDMADGLIAARLPTVEFLDDAISQLVGVRAIIAGGDRPTSDGPSRRGLRRLLQARRADVTELLHFDRGQEAGGRNDCVGPVGPRISAYEAEIDWIDHMLARIGQEGSR